MPKIKLPSDVEAKFRRAARKMRKPGIVAVCLWCGHGYTEYTSEIEDKHFADVCPNAPQELKVNAANRLQGK
jgi:hypothetical protein